MSVRDLIDAIAAGDSQVIQQQFEAEMASRISARLDNMRQEVAQNMFREEVEEVDESCEKMEEK